MNIRKILAMTLSVMMILTMMVIPASADMSAIDLAFIGVGSEGVAYDDLTLPATLGEDAITWSTTTTDVIEIVDNTTAKILKQKDGAELDANVVATIGGESKTVNFKVGYIWAEKEEKYSQNFDNASAISDGYEFRSSISTDSLNVEDGKLVIHREVASSTDIDLMLKRTTKHSNVKKYIFDLDFMYDNTLSSLILWFPYYNSARNIDLRFNANGEVSWRISSSTKIGQLREISSTGSAKVYGGKITVVIDMDNSSCDVLLDGNLIGTALIPVGKSNDFWERFRIYDGATSSKGTIWINSVEMYAYTDVFDGLEKEVINPVEEGGDASVYSNPLTLPATNTATDAVTWTAGSNMDVSGSTATAKASYFEGRNATVTATINDAVNGKTYLKDYTFSVAKADFPADVTFTVDGTPTAGGTLTATIEGIDPIAEGNLTVIMAIYNDDNGVKSLADVEIAPQAVTESGTLSVTDSLSDGVKADSIVKMFVFDGMGTLIPLTTATLAQ